MITGVPRFQSVINFFVSAVWSARDVLRSSWATSKKKKIEEIRSKIKFTRQLFFLQVLDIKFNRNPLSSVIGEIMWTEGQTLWVHFMGLVQRPRE